MPPFSGPEPLCTNVGSGLVLGGKVTVTLKSPTAPHHSVAYPGQEAPKHLTVTHRVDTDRGSGAGRPVPFTRRRATSGVSPTDTDGVLPPHTHSPLQNTCTLREAGHFAQPLSFQASDHLLSGQRHRSARAAGRRPNSMDPAAVYGGRAVSQGQSPVTTAISNLSSAGNCALSLHPRLAHRCCANIPSASQREGARAQMV
jgi:hypothetical protein